MSSISGGTAGSVPINPVLYLKGNTGGDVGPDALGVIQVVGSGNINVAGNAGTNTETITLVGTTNHAVQVGNAAGSLTSIPVGLTGQVLTGVTGADPVFAAPAASAITITGDAGGALGPSNAFTFTGGATGLTFTGAGTTETLGGVLVIANGGTNANAMANTFGVNYFDGTRIVTTAVGTATHVLTSNGAGVAPTFQALPAGGITSITGDTGGAQAGPAITLAGGATGLSFGGAANTITTTFAGITANGGTVSLATDATASAINIGTGAGVKTSTFGSTNTTSATTVQSGTGALNITATNGALTMNSGTGTLAIANDATAQTVNIATGAGAKLTQLGTTNGASSLALRYGTADFTLASATGTVMSALDTGEITYPLQPAFQAYLGTTDSNATGDGTNFRLGAGNALTEVFDQSNDFVTTGTFTAPVTGKYFFFMGLLTDDTDASHTTWQPQITTTGNTFNLAYQHGFTNVAAGGFLGGNGSVFCTMTAGDTCTFNIIVSGGTKVVDVIGNQGLTFVGGHLVL